MYFEREATNKTTVHSKYNYAYDSNKDKHFDKRKDEVAFLICFLFDCSVFTDKWCVHNRLLNANLFSFLHMNGNYRNNDIYG
jgi:hypothetical protein